MTFNDFFIHILNAINLILNILRIRRRYVSKVRLDNKVVVITGGNTGLGKETAFQLSLRGAQIIIGCRDLIKADSAVKDIKEKNPNAEIKVLKLDLSSLRSVRQFVKSVSEVVTNIDILINNAAVFGPPETDTEDGFEMTFGTNHLGHFLLTLSLLPLLRNSSKARVITIASLGHSVAQINFSNINLRNNAYRPLKAYNQSKLANVLFSRELSRRLGPQSNVKTYSLHPGIVGTDLSRNSGHFIKTFLKRFLFVTPELGVQTILFCALEPTLDNESGKYYDDCRRVDQMVSQAEDNNTAQQLWELSSDLVKLEDNLRI